MEALLNSRKFLRCLQGFRYFEQQNNPFSAFSLFILLAEEEI